MEPQIDTSEESRSFLDFVNTRIRVWQGIVALLMSVLALIAMLGKPMVELRDTTRDLRREVDNMHSHRERLDNLDKWRAGHNEFSDAALARVKTLEVGYAAHQQILVEITSRLAAVQESLLDIKEALRRQDARR